MLPTGVPAAPLALTVDDLAALDQARGWAKFLGVIGYIGCGLCALGVLLMGASMAMVPKGSAGPIVGSLVFMLVMTGYLVVYSIMVMRYASGIARHASGDADGLTKAFAGLKSVLILCVASYVLTILFTVGMAVLQLLGITTTAAP